jgi:acetyl esterase/lipase
MDYSKQTYVWKIVDGHEIHADVYRAPGESVRPVILWVHGGALIIGARTSLPTDELNLYLESGYVVVSVDYRLAPESKLPAILEDLVDAYAWVREEGPALFNIDPNRVAVVGHSAGGYLTLASGFLCDPRPRALVSFYGYGDLVGPWYSKPDPFYLKMPAVSRKEAWEVVGKSVISDPPAQSPAVERFHFYLYCRQNGRWPEEVGGHDPAVEAEWFAKHEPLRNVTSAYPPTMLLHGENDTDVPFEQSVLMADALKRNGVVHELVSSQEWGHGFDGAGLEDKAVQDAFGQVLQFLKEHMGR